MFNQHDFVTVYLEDFVRHLPLKHSTRLILLNLLLLECVYYQQFVIHAKYEIPTLQIQIISKIIFEKESNKTNNQRLILKDCSQIEIHYFFN